MRYIDRETFFMDMKIVCALISETKPVRISNIVMRKEQ